MATSGTQAWSGGSKLAELIRSWAEQFPELSQR